MVKNRQVSFLFFIFYILYFITPQLSFAITLQSPQYRIETDTQIGKFGSNIAIIDDTFAAKGYIISSRLDTSPFTITISQNTLDLGKPDSAHTVFTKQFIMAINSARYTIVTFKPERFANFNTSLFIPDTRCDGKKQLCTVSSAGKWRSSSAYGFGYTIVGKNAPDDFGNGARFRPFSSDPAAIIQSDFPHAKNEYHFRLKTVVPADQPSGTYQTTIHIIALADF